jgi:hypothetical protein
MKLQTKEEIKDWLDKYGIENYTINDNLTVDVNGSVDLYNYNITEIPLKFNDVRGVFNCSYNQLTSLIFSPKKMGGSFNCSYNQLTSLEFSPQMVGGSFNSSDNKIKSLEFCTNEISVNFYCSNNELNTLFYMPKIINMEIFLENNQLLGKYQYIKTYTDLLEASKLYELEDKLKKNLSVISGGDTNKIKAKI